MTILRPLKWLRRARSASKSKAVDDANNVQSHDASAVKATTALCREGEALLLHGEPDAALATFQRAIDTGGETAAGHIGQGRAYLALERRQDAADSLEVALALQPTSIEALTLLARIRREAGAFNESLELLMRARSADPQNAETLCDLASTLDHYGRFEDAIETYRDAIRIAPSDARAKVNLGLIFLLHVGDAASAEAHFRSALEVVPDQIEAWANLGLALHDQGRYAEELAVYERALSRWPDNVELRWNRAIAHLAHGRFEQGWDGYELRLIRRGGRDVSRFKYPQWDGSLLTNARLLVLAEQGLGDEIMFSSCLSQLTAVGQAVVLETAPKLAPLLARSFPQIEVHGRERDAPLDWLNHYVDIAARTTIGSLPWRLRRRLSDFSNHPGYLRADASRVEFYKGVISRPGGKMTIGVSWRGGTHATGRALRSVPLTDLKPLLAIKGTHFIALQHRLEPKEKELAAGLGISFFMEPDSGVDELASLVSALDLVITVDNLNLHLSGALGRRAWGLLGMSPDWRWLNAGTSSHWYPSVTLFRSKELGGWKKMLSVVADRLESSLLRKTGDPFVSDDAF